jgi:hypothetical protein
MHCIIMYFDIFWKECLYLMGFHLGTLHISSLFDRKECACTPVRFFAILSMQRSGSGWFETLLNSHTNISSNGEIFSVKPRRSNMTTIMRTLNQLYNLDWYSSSAKNECTAAVGLKWMLNQVKYSYTFLCAFGTVLLHIRRGQITSI